MLFYFFFVLPLTAYIVYLIVKHRWTKLRELSYKLVRQAEQSIVGTKRGKERFTIVLDQLYNMIPVWMRFFIPQSLLKKKLQEWFDLVKDSLDDGEINNSIQPQKPPDKF